MELPPSPGRPGEHPAPR